MERHPTFMDSQFHLCRISKAVKFIEAESRRMILRDCRRKRRGVVQLV
jgi:hypothetical protein